MSSSSNSQQQQQQQLPSIPNSWVRGYFISETPWAALHTRPTVLTIFLTMCVFLPVALWLQTTVLDSTSHLNVFLCGSVVVMLGYYCIHRGLSWWSTSFGRLSRDKRIYAVSNLMKASVLASITPIAIYQLTMIVLYNQWDNHTLKNLGCLYAVPDFVSLILVRRMAATTVVHHVCVVAFNYFSIHNDYNEDNVCRLIVVYGAFSTFGYVVYLLLASRFLGVSPAMSRHLSAGALVTYVVCCGINWTWQASYLRHLLSNDTEGKHRTSVFVYMVVVSFVMWDDLALNRWLLQNVRARSHQAQSQVAKSVLIRQQDQDDNDSDNENDNDDVNQKNEKDNDGKRKERKQRHQHHQQQQSISTTTTAEDGDNKENNVPNSSTSSNTRHPTLQPIRISRPVRSGNQNNNNNITTTFN